MRVLFFVVYAGLKGETQTLFATSVTVFFHLSCVTIQKPVFDCELATVVSVLDGKPLAQFLTNHLVIEC